MPKAKCLSACAERSGYIAKQHFVQRVGRDISVSFVLPSDILACGKLFPLQTQSYKYGYSIKEHDCSPL